MLVMCTLIRVVTIHWAATLCGVYHWSSIIVIKANSCWLLIFIREYVTHLIYGISVHPHSDSVKQMNKLRIAKISCFSMVNTFSNGCRSPEIELFHSVQCSLPRKKTLSLPFGRWETCGYKKLSHLPWLV